MGNTVVSSTFRRSETAAEDDVFRALADSTRRRLLGVLYGRAPDSVTQRDLATSLVPENQEKRDDSQIADAVEQMHISLHHVHLPHLEAAGLIEYDTDHGEVTIVDHPAFEDAGITRVVRGAFDAGPDSLDTLFAVLTNARRRTILDVLSHQLGPIHTETLAREIGAKEQGTTEAAVSPEDIQGIRLSLQHVHLPALVDAELVEYDAEERTVEYRGHPELRVPWMHSVFGPDFRASLTVESESAETGTIRGSEQVVSFGQSLIDRAENELFCMVTHTDLLQAGCLARVRDAADRGVDVYLGTRDETVREYVRENASEVILWEPEMNWINIPVDGNNVGRLVVADREAVMLGTLQERTDDGIRTEQALVGEGMDNALVVMLAQLLRPYLDQIDQDPETIEAQLPF